MVTVTIRPVLELSVVEIVQESVQTGENVVRIQEVYGIVI